MISRIDVLRGLRRLHWLRERDPVAGGVRGWNWDNPPIRPRAYLGLGVYEVAYRYCPNTRDVFLRRVEHFQAQLLVYALLANKLIGPVRKALLVAGDKVKELIVDKDLLAYAYKFVEKTWNSILNEKPPIVNQVLGKCATCWYRRYCLRVLLD